MKLLLIGPFPPPIHGMSLANQILYRGLQRKHVIKIIDTKSSSKLWKDQKIGFLGFQKLLAALGPLFRGSLWILSSEKPDLVYITPGQANWGYLKYVPFIWFAHFRGIPCVIHIHGGYFRHAYDQTSGWKRRLIDGSLKRLSGVIVLGESLRYMFEGLVPEEMIFTCPNGVEDEIFATEEEINQKIRRWQEDDTIRVLYLSNLLRSKGILDLLEAIKLLKQDGVKVHLDVAGAIEPGIRKEVERYFLELDKEVTYHGVVQGEKKKELLLRNYIFCLPTYYPNEGQPISILEAMANGCAIVTTDHGGIKDVVTKENGIYVGKSNPCDLKNALQSKNLEATMIANYQRANQKYHCRGFASRIDSILHKILCPE